MPKIFKAALKKIFWFFVCFGVPVFLWLFLFHDQVIGRTPISSEHLSTYSGLKFYLDNLARGVFPLWNPFILWGKPNSFTLTQISLFNPLWLITYLLTHLGCPFYPAYLFSIIIYFLTGLAGFYLLARSVLRHQLASYVAFLILLFSSLSFPMFVQYIMILIYVPAIWFFFFLSRFVQTQGKAFLIGMVYSLSLIASTYLPFYFLTRSTTAT